ncbi:MAG TPA: L,D-transpeptidase family protein [Candidatus Sulfotelmatobacter sp.]|jgi:L,D-peptidoglycan transpeptidase YkuD (ErfK/YbiS/YcfS/YnhG family)|nr:L,D-transpeptidase family protein [Candidatus Sulfotelmatobacter sp.]
MTADILVTADGWLRCRGLAFPCVLGRSGMVADKREGDGGTPIGAFPLRRVLYRPDRGEAPRTGLPVAAIAPDDGWCDDPAHADYNCPVKLPHPASCERMWRDDGVYDVVVVLGHNDDPPRPGLGSAIFMHVARPDGSPTEGCVALASDDLKSLLEICQTGTILRFVQP